MAAAAPNRLVAVWCPDWPVVAAGIDPTTPAAVLRANRVVARTAAAASAGVQLDQRRREAQKRCPELEIVAHDPEQDAAAFEFVARAIARFAPRIEVVEPGWACLAARGPSRYFGGEVAFADQLLVAVETAALEVGASAQVHIGVADGRFPSAVAARRSTGSPLIVEPGGSPAFLAPLPVGWLHLCGEADTDLTGLFTRMGLDRLGALAALDPTDVLARFGLAGQHAHRIAQGQDRRGADGVAPPEPFGAEQVFDDPVQVLEPLVFTAKTLADDLSTRLAGNGLTCTRLVVAAETDHGERDERVWYRAAGLSPTDMVERVRWQLAGWMSSGQLTAGVVFLRLAPEEVRGDTGEQAAMWGGNAEADDRAVRAVARLTSLVGDQAVLVPEWKGGRLPADRFGWTPAAAVDLLDRNQTRHRLGPVGREREDDGTEPWPGSLPAPSPTVVLPSPEPARLADAAGRPIRVDGRGELSAVPETFSVADRVPRLVIGWAGPWIVDERWWDLTGRRRLARIQLLCEDGAAYLAAVEHQRWWLLAAYR